MCFGRPEFVTAMLEDLRWFGIRWQEGPDCGGPFGPYSQRERRALYLAAFEKLREGGLIYPCKCSRRDVQLALGAPHQGEEESIYPGTCRPSQVSNLSVESSKLIEVAAQRQMASSKSPISINWRWRVPDGEAVSFVDSARGPQTFVAGRDFGDFVVWRHDGAPSYQLAVVVDDAAMQITEVVRGTDLLLSTARQLLLYRALGLVPPDFYHIPLVTDPFGVRLAKRHEGLSLRALRASGMAPESLRERPEFRFTEEENAPKRFR